MKEAPVLKVDQVVSTGIDAIISHFLTLVTPITHHLACVTTVTDVTGVT